MIQHERAANFDFHTGRVVPAEPRVPRAGLRRPGSEPAPGPRAGLARRRPARRRHVERHHEVHRRGGGARRRSGQRPLGFLVVISMVYFRRLHGRLRSGHPELVARGVRVTPLLAAVAAAPIARTLPAVRRPRVLARSSLPSPQRPPSKRRRSVVPGLPPELDRRRFRRRCVVMREEPRVRRWRRAIYVGPLRKDRVQSGAFFDAAGTPTHT